MTESYLKWQRPAYTPADLLTINQIAALAGVQPDSIRKRRERHWGTLEPWWVGGLGDPHLFLRVDVEEWLRGFGWEG